jgi:hypothetical protein
MNNLILALGLLLQERVTDFTTEKPPERRSMLKITRVSNGEVVVKLSGRMDAEHISELETLLRAETGNQPLVLDLKDLTLVDRDAVNFLKRCEASGILFTGCPVYIREWLNGERRLQ